MTKRQSIAQRRALRAARRHKRIVRADNAKRSARKGGHKHRSYFPDRGFRAGFQSRLCASHPVKLLP